MKIPDDFDGPQRKRQCTDCLFLLCLLLCTTCMIFIGLAAVGFVSSPYVKKGDPARLLNGVDYNGNICGSPGLLVNLKQRWSPSYAGSNPSYYGILMSSGFSICVSSCPKIGEIRIDPYDFDQWTATTNTVNILNYCTTTDENNYIGDQTLSIFGDFLRAANVLAIGGLLLPAFLSLIFLCVIRLPLILRTIVWGFIILIFGILGIGAFILLERAKDRKSTRLNSSHG